MNQTHVGRMIAVAIEKHKMVRDAIDNYTKLYLNETNEEELNRLYGTISALNEFGASRKRTVVDQLINHEKKLDALKDSNEDYFFCEQSFLEGFCDGLKRLIGMHKTLKNINKRAFVIMFLPNEQQAVLHRIAFEATEEWSELNNYQGEILPFESYYLVTADIDEVYSILQEREEDCEYAIILLDDKENPYNVKTVNKMSKLNGDEIYFIKPLQGNSVHMGTYIRYIIASIELR